MGFQLTQLVILARILGPEAFGLMALVLVITRILQPLADAGLHQAVIFHPNLSKEILSTLYWLNLLLGGLLTLSVYLGAPFLAHLLGDERLTELLMLVCPILILGPLASQIMALFTRDLEFDRLAIIQIGSLGAEFATAVTLAWLGWGVYSLVWGYIARFAVQASLAWFFAGFSYLPLWTFQVRAAWPYIRFGLFETGNLLINTFSSQIDKALVGKMLGPTMLGYYSIAWELIVFPIARINPIINRVSFPIFAKIKAVPKQLNQYYFRSVSLLLLINIPVLIGLALVAESFVEVFYGKEWLPAAPLIQILAIVGIHKAFANPGAGLLLTQGRADIGFYWNVGWTLALTLIIALGLYQYPKIETAAWTQLAAAFLLGWIWHWLVARYGQVPYRRLLLFAGRTLLLC
ncbi:MAG: MOP flippase family protein, partial [Bacteroidota bacterium]